MKKTETITIYVCDKCGGTIRHELWERVLTIAENNDAKPDTHFCCWQCVRHYAQKMLDTGA